MSRVKSLGCSPPGWVGVGVVIPPLARVGPNIVFRGIASADQNKFFNRYYILLISFNAAAVPSKMTLGDYTLEVRYYRRLQLYREERLLRKQLEERVLKGHNDSALRELSTMRSDAEREADESAFMLRAVPFIMDNRTNHRASTQVRIPGQRSGFRVQRIQSTSMMQNKRKREEHKDLVNSMCEYVQPESPTRRGEIMRRYVREVELGSCDNNHLDAPPPDTCQHCGGNMIRNEREGDDVCSICGKCIPNNLSTSITGLPDTMNMQPKFPYLRINHFGETLSQHQGKEAPRISDAIIASVQRVLRVQRRDPATITPIEVRKILKMLNNPVFYEHTNAIVLRVGGKIAPPLTSQQEDECRVRFWKIQQPYDFHRQSSRQNFFSYPFCLYKIFEVMGLYEQLPFILLLKSRDKLHSHDQIFRKICIELGWPFYKTV